MNARSSLLAVVFGAIAVLVVLALFGVYRAGVSQGQLAAELAPPPKTMGMSLPDRAARPRMGEPASGLPASEEALRASKVQALLDAKNEQIKRQQSELVQRKEELRRLEEEYEAMVSLLSDELASAPMPGDAGSGPGRDAATARTREELQADLRKLRQERDEARKAADAVMAELEQVRTASTMELAAIQNSATQALQAERTLREAATGALVESGQAALPFLMLMLRDERPAVRSWTCGVLGAMRSRAGEAAPLLSDVAASDTDAGVRDAARRALRSIRD